MEVHKMVLHGIVMFLTLPSFWSTRLNHQKDLNDDSLAPLKSPPGVLLNISTQREEDVVVTFKGKDFKFRLSGTGQKVAIILTDQTACPLEPLEDMAKGLVDANYRVLMQIDFVAVPDATDFGPKLQELAKKYDTSTPTKLPMLVGVGRGVDLAAQVAHDLQGSVERLALLAAHRSDQWATPAWTFHEKTKEGNGDFTVKGGDIFPKFQSQAMLFQMRGKTEELVKRSLPTLIAFAKPSLDRDNATKLTSPLPGGATIEIRTLTGEFREVEVFDGSMETSVGNIDLWQFGGQQFGERNPLEAPKKVAFAFGGYKDADFNKRAPEWTHIAAHLALNGFVVFVPWWSDHGGKTSVRQDKWPLALQEIAQKYTTGSTDGAEDIELPLLMGKCIGGAIAVQASQVLQKKVLRRVFVVPHALDLEPPGAADVSGFGPTAIFYSKGDGLFERWQTAWQTFAKDEALVFQADSKGDDLLGVSTPYVVDFATAEGGEPADPDAADPGGEPADPDAADPGGEPADPDAADPGEDTPWYKKFSTYMYGALILIFICVAAYGVYYFQFRQDPDASGSSPAPAASSDSSAGGRDAKDTKAKDESKTSKDKAKDKAKDGKGASRDPVVPRTAD